MQFACHKVQVNVQEVDVNPCVEPLACEEGFMRSSLPVNGVSCWFLHWMVFFVGFHLCV